MDRSVNTKHSQVRIALFLLGLFFNGCTCQSIECHFMRGPLETAESRLSQYPLEEEYQIFRYANSEIHPPMLWLANPIARRGAEAIPFLSQRIHDADDDMEIRDILVILHRMVLFNTYDVKSNQALMAALSARVAGVFLSVPALLRWRRKGW